MVLLSKKDIQLSRKRLRGDAFSLFIIPNIGPVQKLDFERVEVGKRQQQKIAKLLGEAKAEEVISGNYSEQEAEYRAAFKLIGKEYIEDLDKRESFLLENPDIYNQFASALPLVESVNDKLLGGQAYKPMQDQFVVVKAEKPGIDKKLLGLGVLGLTLAAGLGAFLYKQHLDEQMRKPYKQAGLSDEQAKEFIANYPNQNGNSTWVSFAKFWAKDKALADESLKTFGNLKDSLEYLYLSDDNQLLIKSLEAYGKDATSFVNFVKSNSYDGLGFLKDLPQLAKNYQEVLPAYSANSTLIKIVYDQFQRDPRVSFDRNELFLRGLKEYQDLNLIKKNLMIQTVQALNNLTLAYQQGLPRLDKNSAWLLTNATQISKDIADFSPIIFYSVDGNNYVLESDVPRNTWILAEHLKGIQDSGFEIIKHPEMFEGLNGKVIANAWSLFDAKYGISYAEKEKSGRIINPTDKDVLDLMMLQWNLYSNKAPQLNESNKIYNRDFPWYDSNQLKQLYPDKNTRRQALFFLFYIPNTTFDMEKRERVYGVEGAKLSLTQAEKEYETISSIYPNGKVVAPVTREEHDVRAWYYDWLFDRAVHGLNNTFKQFLGIDVETFRNIPFGHEQEYLKDYKGIDQYLTKNWKYWDLVKFIAGYERWNVGNYPPAIEEDGINYLIPQTLQAFGSPVYFVHINPTPKGAAQYEWAVSLPYYVASRMKNEFGEKILTGPAKGFGLYLVKDGIVEDGIKELLGFIGETTFYRDKNGVLESNTLLAPEIGIYLMKP